MSRRKTAVDGEACALESLMTRGYVIVDVNVRPLEGMARGEIDIIAWEGDILCFVEVKTRRSVNADPIEAVTLRKQRQIATLAEAYLALHALDDVPCRFDVVTVRFIPRRPEPIITLYREAFRAGES
jgi:putative endonuclease